jgi:hypothetical protein
MLRAIRQLFLAAVVLIVFLIIVLAKVLKQGAIFHASNIADNTEACSDDVACTASTNGEIILSNASPAPDLKVISDNAESANISYSDSPEEMYPSKTYDVTANSAAFSDKIVPNDDRKKLVSVGPVSQLPMSICHNTKHVVHLNKTYDRADDWQVVVDGATYVYSAHADFRAVNHTIIRIFGLMLWDELFSDNRAFHYCQLHMQTRDVYVTAAKILTFGRRRWSK